MGKHCALIHSSIKSSSRHSNGWFELKNTFINVGKYIIKNTHWPTSLPQEVILLDKTTQTTKFNNTVQSMTSASLLFTFRGCKLLERLWGVLPEDARYPYLFYRPIWVNTRSTCLVQSQRRAATFSMMSYNFP